MKKYRWSAWLLLCLLLVGCAQMGEENYGGVSTPWEEGASQQEEAKPQGLTAFALAYQQGQTLDPLTCSEGSQLQLTMLLYEPLFQLDSSFQPQPLLCASYLVSSDYLTYTLVIRQGVLFSDGSTLAAGDVVDTLRRAMASQRYANRLQGVQQVRRQGDDQVVITLRQPNANFLSLLDIPVVKSGTEDSGVPVGTGPYLLVTAGDGAYLTANPDWWQGKGLPLERIELVHAKDSDTAMYLFTAWETAVYATDLTGGEKPLTGSLDTVDAPTTTMQYVGINVNRTALQDLGLRQALQMGVPREMVVDGYLSGHGHAAQFPVSPLAPQYPATLEKDYSVEAYRQATQALEEDVRLTLLVNGDNTFKTAIATYLAESWTAGRVTVTVEALPWAEYTAALEQGDFDLYYGEVRLTADWDVSRLVGTGGSLNYGGWSNETTDSLLSNFNARGLGGDQLAFYRHLQEQAPVIPVCFKTTSLLTHSGTMENAVPTASNLFQNFPDWVIHIAGPETDTATDTP